MMDDLDNKLAGLTAAKQKLLELRLQQRQGQAPKEAVIPRLPENTPGPLSYGQRGQWFLYQLEPQNPYFNIGAAMRVKGQIDTWAFEQALTALVKRHEILRTVISDQDGQLKQIIQPVGPVKLQQTDLREFAGEEQAVRLAHLLREEAHRPFDLTNDTMLRFHLFQLGDEEFILTRNTHHAASDKWSAGILDGELGRLYAAFRRGDSPPSPPKPPIRYADFATWQQEWLQGEAAQKELAYWRSHLENANPSIALPFDHPRPAHPSHQGATKSQFLAPSMVNDLEAFSRRQGVTPFMTLLAVFKLLLHRYSGQTDILVGAPVSGRSLAETHNVVGLFINTLVLRSDLSGNPSFLELLQRVRQVTIGGLAHQQLPFEKLVEAIQPERHFGQTPLFQVMFDYLVTPAQPLILDGVEMTLLDFAYNTTAHDLTLMVAKAADQLKVTFEYRTDLFEPETIQRLLDHFHNLLAGILQEPDRSLGALPLISSEERQKIVHKWNQSAVEFPRHLGLHQLFEAQAEKSPRAPALLWPGGAYNYEQLNSQANRLARYIQEQGASPGTTIGLCFPRSPEMLVSMLAVLKAGCAYLPLDPAYPPSRLALMLTDSGAKLLLTKEPLPLAGEESFHGSTIFWDQVSDDIARQPGTYLEWSGHPDDIAYVIYTSGSSGQPKGVQIPHSAVVNFTQFAQAYYQVQPDDRVLQFAAIGFDTAVEEIFPAWAAGASVVIGPDLMAGTLQAFMRWVSEMRITVLDLPTAFWHAWVAELNRQPIPSTVRLVIVGGEEASLSAFQEWTRQAPAEKVRWVNTYGPTEATVVALTYDPAQHTSSGHKLPIGRPIANVQTFVLDAYGNPAPIGVAGELYIGGAGLARGYVNRPEETAARFLLTDLPGLGKVRLYRTGDLARYSADGQIIFLGRADEQLKLRGFRIEPEEIAIALRGHQLVRHAAVVANEVGGQLAKSDRQLVAFIQLQEDAILESGELRAYLQERLPAYMIPACFVILETWPLTAHRKVDRQQLLDLAREGPGRSPTYVPPETPLEKLLTGIWAEVLAVEQVGLSDNFFTLGGHSLLTIRLVAYLDELLRLKIPLRAIFEAPTVETLIARLAETGEARQKLERIAEIITQVSQLSEAEVSARLASQANDQGSHD